MKTYDLKALTVKVKTSQAYGYSSALIDINLTVGGKLWRTAYIVDHWCQITPEGRENMIKSSSANLLFAAMEGVKVVDCLVKSDKRSPPPTPTR